MIVCSTMTKMNGLGFMIFCSILLLGLHVSRVNAEMDTSLLEQADATDKLQDYTEWRRGRYCEMVEIKGSRFYQEDRILCLLNVTLAEDALKLGLRHLVDLAAVFDGHAGFQASELSRYMLYPLFLRNYNDAVKKVHHRKIDENFCTSNFDNHSNITDDKASSSNLDILHNTFNEVENLEHMFQDSIKPPCGYQTDGSTYRQILKEALEKSISDIEKYFTEVALKFNLEAGTTACIVLRADEYILVANIGDSKAIMCSTHSSSLASPLIVEELTKDHKPDRDDEKRRIELHGGYVHSNGLGGIPRVMGELAMSRAIGDLRYKRVGVSAEPEFTGWQKITEANKFLILASDGIYEEMDTQTVCDVVAQTLVPTRWKKDKDSRANFLANAIIRKAYESGSQDNLSVVIIPL